MSFELALDGEPWGLPMNRKILFAAEDTESANDAFVGMSSSCSDVARGQSTSADDPFSMSIFGSEPALYKKPKTRVPTEAVSPVHSARKQNNYDVFADAERDFTLKESAMRQNLYMALNHQDNREKESAAQAHSGSAKVRHSQPMSEASEPQRDRGAPSAETVDADHTISSWPRSPKKASRLKKDASTAEKQHSHGRNAGTGRNGGNSGTNSPWKSGNSRGDESRQEPHYPVRPGLADCQYYLKTGKCTYGARCKFNHPVRDERLVTSLNRRDCFDFVQTGKCPYGRNCKYNHPNRKDLAWLGLANGPSTETANSRANRSSSSSQPSTTPVRAPSSPNQSGLPHQKTRTESFDMSPRAASAQSNARTVTTPAQDYATSPTRSGLASPPPSTAGASTRGGESSSSRAWRNLQGVPSSPRDQPQIPPTQDDGKAVGSIKSAPPQVVPPDVPQLPIEASAPQPDEGVDSRPMLRGTNAFGFNTFVSVSDNNEGSFNPMYYRGPLFDSSPFSSDSFTTPTASLSSIFSDMSGRTGFSDMSGRTGFSDVPVRTGFSDMSGRTGLPDKSGRMGSDMSGRMGFSDMSGRTGSSDVPGWTGSGDNFVAHNKLGWLGRRDNGCSTRSYPQL